MVGMHYAFGLRMKIFAATLAVFLSGCSGAPSVATSVCTIDGGAQANVPLNLTAGFGLSGCAPQDARCTATVDGGTIHLSTSATLCSTGNNPGGVRPTAACAIPPLVPGTYTLAPFSRTLDVLVDGGGGTTCARTDF